MKYLSIIAHLAATALFSVIVLLIYCTVQQSYRLAANDPQIQNARDMAANIRYNRAYHKLADSAVDLPQSLAPFMQLYDSNNHLLFSGGAIDGKSFSIPGGVLNTAKQNGENMVSWQPTASVRLAAVAEYTGNTNTAFVVVARSLQETENRESNLSKIIIICWITGFGIIVSHALIQRYLLRTGTVQKV